MPDQAAASAPMLLRAEELGAVMGLFQRAQRLVEVVVQGHSMGSTLPNGTRIRLQCQVGRSYGPGEVVVFVDGPHIVVHRVVYGGRHRRGRQYLLTQGDGLWLPDAPIPVEAVVGPVIARQHQGAWEMLAAAPPRTVCQECLGRLALGVMCTLLVLHVPLAHWTARRLRATLAGLQRWRATLLT